MDKMKFETPNLTAKNLAKIAELFPGVVTEGKVNFDLLRSMLGEDVYGDEAYEFTWVGKRAAIAEAGRPIRKTLRPCVEESKDWDITENLYIEGDNLDVLKLLQESYLGKVKMVYIDPPYNTGNDFVYRDDFKQSREEYSEETGEYDEDGNRLFKNTETNGRFHSDWCSMIYPRLVIARNMLREDGVIFISIDDNEVAQLRKICDEVFGEGNFVGQWNWFKSSTPPNLSKKIKKNIEYILCYQKSINDIKFKGIQKSSNSSDPFTKPQNTIKTLIFPPKSIHINLKDGSYEKGIYGTKKFPNELISELTVENGMNSNEVTFKNKFIWTQSKLDEEIVNGTVIYLSKDIVLSYKKSNYDKEVPPNLIDSSVNVETTEKAGKDLYELFNIEKIFDYPKSISLLKYLLGFLTSSDDLVLDFFSGSSTTAHAVMQLNAEDGGNRKFIMVQLPEICDDKSEAFKAGYKNICEIGKERIRRAGDKIIAEMHKCNGSDNNDGLAPTGALDIGFRVLKLDSTNMNDVYYAAGDYTQDMILQMENNIKLDRTDMDLLYSCLLDWGLPLSMPHTHEKIDGFTVHTYNNGDLIACFEERISESAIREIAGRNPLRAVFRDSSFTSSPEKINVFEIFKLLAPNTNVRVI